MFVFLFFASPPFSPLVVIPSFLLGQTRMRHVSHRLKVLLTHLIPPLLILLHLLVRTFLDSIHSVADGLFRV